MYATCPPPSLASSISLITGATGTARVERRRFVVFSFMTQLLLSRGIPVMETSEGAKILRS